MSDCNHIDPPNRPCAACGAGTTPRNPPDAQLSVQEAQATRLDPNRQAVATRRCLAASEVARYHEGQASAQRGTIATLVRTWGLCTCCFEPLPADYDESGDRDMFEGVCEDCYVSP